jgi:hypothetical protein
MLIGLSQYRGQVAGYHALRIVGWGEEAGQRYWRLANSWGSSWGEDGYVRIRRGEDECQVIAGGQPRGRTDTSGSGHERMSVR